MGKWTPGPWVVRGRGTIRNADSKGNPLLWIADLHWNNRDNNARLIAAAPEMAEALINAASLFAGRCADAPETQWLRDTRALLARIKGEA